METLPPVFVLICTPKITDVIQGLSIPHSCNTPSSDIISTSSPFPVLQSPIPSTLQKHQIKKKKNKRNEKNENGCPVHPHLPDLLPVRNGPESVPV